MLQELKKAGYDISDPWDAVDIFENKLASYAGSKFAVCVDSCSNAIFLCLKYLNISQITICLPSNTYASVPMQCIHAGNKIKFIDKKWSGYYKLDPTKIIDGATKFSKNMYIEDTYFCVSFHHRKTLKIGRGGVILTNDEKFVNWCRPMCYDGRNKRKRYIDDQFFTIGYHMYMTPEEAAKGILLLDVIPDVNEDKGGSHTYTDLRRQTIFEPYRVQ